MGLKLNLKPKISDVKLTQGSTKPPISVKKTQPKKKPTQAKKTEPKPKVKKSAAPPITKSKPSDTPSNKSPAVDPPPTSWQIFVAQRTSSIYKPRNTNIQISFVLMSIC